MALLHSTWRRHPFKVGYVYVAAQTFPGFPRSEFVKGVSYKLTNVAHSHYDSATVFSFLEIGSDKTCNWWWHDEQQEALCFEHFEIS